VAKILENMEIGHNVLHGQWDWMRDPDIHSANWEWDSASTADAWKHAHNFVHHTYTNVLGKDRDLGYAILRIAPDQPWHPLHLAQPAYIVPMALLFEWAIAVYDIELENVRAPTKPWPHAKAELGNLWRKARKQLVKDYVAFPLLSGSSAVPVLLGNLTANAIRNVWAHTIIVCGHFPDGAQTFGEERLANETRGDWYIRQTAWLVQPRRAAAAAPDERQSLLPDRTPPLPRPPEQPLRRARPQDPRDLRALRAALHQRLAAPPIRTGDQARPAPGVPRRRRARRAQLNRAGRRA
jgi:hypothetical protein